jgi:hypothetical protein
MLDEPTTVVWGSEAAAPLFAAVAAPVLRHLGIAPADLPSVQLVRTAEPAVPAAGSPPPPLAAPLMEPDAAEPVMPDLAGRSLRQALVLLAGYDLEVSVVGRGMVVRQTPLPGAAVAAGSACRLELAPPGGGAAPAARGTPS